MPIVEIIGLVVVGLFAGTLAATLGVGGGIIYVPVLVSLFGFTQFGAQGTSLAVILATSIVGTVVHGRAGRVLWKVALVTGGVGIISALAGAQIALSMDESFLRRVFAVVLAILTVQMARRAWILRRASAASDGSSDSAG